MTPQEESMLNDLIGRVDQTQLTEKDPDAEQLLNQRLGRNSNALYILAQTVLVQKYALEQATAQLQQLKQQQAQAQTQPAHATSFLGSLLGHRDAAPPPPPPPPAPGYGAPPQGQGWSNVPAYQGSYQGVPAYGGAPAYGPPPTGGGGSFLRSAATTAAGVAAGALAFEGVESLMHGFGHEGGGGFGVGDFGGGGGRPEEVINNYYGDSGGQEGRQDLADNNLADDNSNDDSNLADDLTSDSYDDSSSFDDSSSGDDLV